MDSLVLCHVEVLSLAMLTTLSDFFVVTIFHFKDIFMVSKSSGISRSAAFLNLFYIQSILFRAENRFVNTVSILIWRLWIRIRKLIQY